MTVYEYVARSFNTDPVGFADGYGTLVGTNPLDTVDGDTSYVENNDTGNASSIVGTKETTFRWEPVGASAPGDPLTWSAVWCRFAWKRHTGSAGGWGSIQHRNPETGAITISFGTSWGPYPDEAVADGYLLQSATIDVEFDWVDPLGPDTWYVLKATGNVGRAGLWRFTYARLFIEAGIPPLRQRNRDTTRARNLASRQRGLRARGYL